MKAKEAVAQRILQLCEERNLTVNMLATESGVPPSSVYSMLNQKSKNPGVVSLKKLCDGLGITLRFFFDSGSQAFLLQIVEELDQETLVLTVHAEHFIFVTVIIAQTTDGNITGHNGLQVEDFAAIHGFEKDITFALGNGFDQRLDILGILKKHHNHLPHFRYQNFARRRGGL
ncbi:MAG: helix-turn-helix transcriptional regulator [Clostridia bacterium]|nr:helix-turn-helix transcriptional regulator [Clostridia bacterium]MBR6571942.1 helix-turn-helix transcriptional regulator [Clostridia bacterium]